MAERASDDVSDDRLLGGQVAFRQPVRGYRAAIDPVLLAAAVPAGTSGTLLDLGCGAGAALLCLGARLRDSRLVGLERDAAMARLADGNIRTNGWEDRACVVVGDAALAPLRIGAFDEVVVNPPYLAGGRADVSPVPGRAAANVENGPGLAAWCDGAIALCRKGGAVTFVHRADRLDELLAALRPRAGGIVVFPLWPREGRPAKRVIVRARKGVRAPLQLCAGLVLHRDDGRFTEAAERVLRAGAPLQLEGGPGGG